VQDCIAIGMTVEPTNPPMQWMAASARFARSRGHH
jgi:hypothetical protein